MKRSSIALALASVAAFGASAHAELIQLHVMLDGLQEVPANASPGWGMATVTADTQTRFIEIFLEYGGLVGTPTAAHLHGLAAPGQNAGVLIGLTFGANNFIGSGVLSEANFAGFMQGLTYINLHTSVFPGGEIRGQVIVPGPGGAVALLGAGLVGARRRRRA